MKKNTPTPRMSKAEIERAITNAKLEGMHAGRAEAEGQFNAKLDKHDQQIRDSAIISEFIRHMKGVALADNTLLCAAHLTDTGGTICTQMPIGQLKQLARALARITSKDGD